MEALIISAGVLLLGLIGVGVSSFIRASRPQRKTSQKQVQKNHTQEKEALEEQIVVGESVQKQPQEVSIPEAELATQFNKKTLSYEKTIGTLSAELEAARLETTQLKQKEKNLLEESAKNKSALEESDKLNKECKDLKEELVVNKAELITLRQEAASLKKQLSDMQDANRLSKATVNSLNKELQGAKEALVEKDKASLEIKKKGAELEIALLKVEQLKQKLMDLVENKSQEELYLLGKIDKLKEESEKFRQDSADIKVELEKEAAARRQDRQELECLQKELTSSKEQIAQQARLQEDNEALKKEIAGLQNSNNQTGSSVEALAKELQELKKALEEKKLSGEKYKKKDAELQSALREIDQLKQIEKTLLADKSEYQAMFQKADNLKKDYKNLEKEFTADKDELAKERSINIKQQAEIDRMRKEFVSLKKQHSQFAAIKKECESLKKELTDIKEVDRESKAKIASLTKELEETANSSQEDKGKPR